MIARFETPNLGLRLLADDDIAFYCRLYTDEAVMRHIGMALSPAAARRAFRVVRRQAATVPPRSWYWRLSRHGADDALGLMALVPDQEGREAAEVGVVLLPEAQGHGYAAEAIAALADRVFVLTRLQLLWTRHSHNHAAAIRLMDKLGFVSEAAGPAMPAQLRWQLRREAWPTGVLP